MKTTEPAATSPDEQVENWVPIYASSNDDDNTGSSHTRLFSSLQKTPAKLQYVARETQRVRLFRNVQGMDSGMEGVIWAPRTVWITNARLADTDFTLDRNGFALVKHTLLQEPIDFFDMNTVLDEYYPKCQALLQDYFLRTTQNRVTVIPFDHNIRQQEKSSANTISTTTIAQDPISIPHGDYTTVSAPRRLELLAQPPKQNDVWRERLGNDPLLDPALAQQCLMEEKTTTRYAFVNVWRNIDPDHPVQSMPLACMDMQSLAIDHAQTDDVNNDDLRTLELIYADRIGENFLTVHNPAHAWYYYPEMTYSEALLIQQWDSLGERRFCIHSAFKDPATPNGAPPRSSIEVRCLVVWDSGSQ